MEWQKVAESLAASGPLAMALGAACALLWRELGKVRDELKAEQAARIADLKSLLKPPS